MATMNLLTNKTKVCFWNRVCAGLYRLGDITVDQIWHSDGPCAGNYMWHVIVDGKTLVKHAYLKEAKKEAIRIDQSVRTP